jgi:hypothetical protein
MRIMIALGAPFYILSGSYPAFGDEPLKGITAPLSLSYDATYAGYKFAEIDFTESNPYEYGGNTVRELECRIESSGILNVSGFYRSIVRDDYTVLYFSSDEGTMQDKGFVQYWFDYENNMIRIESSHITGADTSTVYGELKNVDRRYFDSISLIFRIKDSYEILTAPIYIPVFVDSKPDSVLIESISPGETTGRDGRVVPATIIKGRIPFETFPGSGDGFEIYMSDDDSRIPLKARIEMALGYIEIKLRAN